MALELEGKTEVITGTGQGIGAAIADRLVQEGAHLALSDINFALDSFGAVSSRGYFAFSDSDYITGPVLLEDEERAIQQTG